MSEAQLSYTGLDVLETLENAANYNALLLGCAMTSFVFYLLYPCLMALLCLGGRETGR